MKLILAFLFLCLSLLSVEAQTSSVRVVYTAGVPSTCVRGRVYVNVATGNLYTFKTGTGCILSGNTSGSTITNSAGNNVLTKSNGTNLVASRITDNATDIALAPTGIGTGKITLGEAACSSEPCLLFDRDTISWNVQDFGGGALINIEAFNGTDSSSLSLTDTGNASLHANAVATIGDVFGANKITIDKDNTLITLAAANGIAFTAANSASVSAVNTGKFRFDSSVQRFQFSENGGGYNNIPISSDTAYDESSWNGNLDVPTKNAVRDKIETLSSGATDIDFERNFQVLVPPNGTTRLNVGMGAMSITTPGTGPTTADDSDGIWNSWTTGASSGNEINAQPATFSFYRKEWGGAHTFRVKTGASIAGIRIWIGLGSADPASTATPNGSYAMFRYDTGADGTAFFRTYTDGSAVSPEAQTTTQAIAANTAYTLRVIPSASDIKFYVWSGTAWTLLSTHTTVPDGSMGELWVAKTLEAVDKTFKFSFYRGRHK